MGRPGKTLACLHGTSQVGAFDSDSAARWETHSKRKISGAFSRVERRDQAADKAVNEPEEGRRPSQQGHVNEHVSDGEQKVQTHRARPLQPTLRLLHARRGLTTAGARQLSHRSGCCRGRLLFLPKIIFGRICDAAWIEFSQRTGSPVQIRRACRCQAIRPDSPFCASFAAPTAASLSAGSTSGTSSIRSRMARHAGFLAAAPTVRIDVTDGPPRLAMTR